MTITFHLSWDIKGFMLIMPIFLFIVSFRDAFLVRNHVDFQIVFLQVTAFLPYIFSYFYKITINDSNLIYYSPFRQWKVKISQITKVEQKVHGKGSIYIYLTTENGKRKGFEVMHYDKVGIWRHLRKGILLYSTHLNLPKTLIGNEIVIIKEINQKFHS